VWRSARHLWPFASRDQRHAWEKIRFRVAQVGFRASPEAICFRLDAMYFGADPMCFDPELICSAAEANR
jgi:hypothetical protein